MPRADETCLLLRPLPPGGRRPHRTQGGRAGRPRPGHLGPAQRQLAHRRARDREAQDFARSEASADGACWDELLECLDAELSRLPEKYRAPVVLCELEGRSRREVAELLQLPEGTLSFRLARARKLLARRLARCGTSLAVGGLTAGLAAPAGADVPPSLTVTTVKAAT